MQAPLLAATGVAALLAAAATAAAQPPAVPSQPNQPPAPGQPVTLSQTVEPSFRIEPVVQRFSARRGEVLPFSFAIGSLGREMNVTVKPVSLRQELTGIILHDKHSKPTDALRLTTPNRFQLGPGKQQVIAGEVTVPIAKSNYLSYGLLVREEGRAPNFADAGDAGTKAGIRFVTQYVLRVDIETGVADVGAMKNMRLEQADVIAEGGLPKVSAILHNPTGYAFECWVSAEIEEGRSRPKPFPLGMVSRAGLDGDQRYLVRIMPRTKLRLEAPVTRLVPPGQQTLKVGLSSGRREVVSSEFAVAIDDEQFPALAQKRAVLGGGVAVSPAQLEMGATRQAARATKLEFSNTTGADRRIKLEARTLDGGEVPSIRFSPSEFSLPAGRVKRVRAMLRHGGDANQCATIEVTASDDTGATDRRSLPLAILRSPPAAPELRLSPIEWSQSQGRAGFCVSVTNPSDAYVPLNARLAVGNQQGMQMRMVDGYGRWLAPGATTELCFTPSSPLPPGDYALALELRTREQWPTITREIEVVLSGGDSRTAARAAAPTANR